MMILLVRMLALILYNVHYLQHVMSTTHDRHVSLVSAF